MPPDGTTHLEAERGILAKSASGWARLSTASGNSWSTASAPFLDALLAEENGRRWERQDGVITISGQEIWRIAGRGAAFDIDRLLGYAATPTAAVAVTAAGSHALVNVGDLRTIPPPIVATTPVIPLDSRRARGAQWIIFDGSGQVWDAGMPGWRQAGSNERPWEARDAAEIGGINIGFDPGPRALVDVGLVGGGSAVMPFSWDRGEAMPFDHATALHSDPGAGGAWIGTRLGARFVTLSRSAGGGTIHVPSAGLAQRDVAVRALGRPEIAPDRIEVAFDNGSCAQASGPASAAGAMLTPCIAPADLTERFVADSGRWRISQSSGAVHWRYVIDGNEEPLTMPLRGYLPDDRLSDRVSCGNLRAEQWRDADVVTVNASYLRVPGLRGLFCQREDAMLDGGRTLFAGLYALTANGAQRFSGDRFAPMEAAVADAVRARIEGEVIADAGRLQYGLREGQPVTHLLSRAGQWQDTPWRDGRMVLDQPRALGWRGHLQLVTDAGVVDAPRGHLERDTVVAMTSDPSDGLERCEVTHSAMLDGRTHGLDAAPGAPMHLYCADGSWLVGVTDGSRDLGAFAPQPGADETRLLVEVPGQWTIASELAADGQVRAVSLAFRDEPARLSAGRFDFDTFTALAAPVAGNVELVTASGWWRADRDRLALASTERPALPLPPRDVVSITADLSRRNGASGICATLEDRQALFWPGTGGLESADSCREFRGNDPVWQWWHASGLPVATGISLNGTPISRGLEAGRFADLIVSGAPLSTPDGLILVPAAAGQLVVDRAAGQVLGIYDFDPDGVLSHTAAGDPTWITRDGARRLEGEGEFVEADDLACPGLVPLVAAVTGPGRIMRATPGGEGWHDVALRTASGHRQAMVDCADPDGRVNQSVRRDVSSHPRSIAEGDRGARLLEVTLTDRDTRLRDETREAHLPRRQEDPSPAFVSLPGWEQLYYLEPADNNRPRLMSIRLAPALSLVAREGQPLPPPPVQPAPAAPVATDATPPVVDPPAASIPAAPPVPEPAAVVAEEDPAPVPAPADIPPAAEPPPAAPASPPSARGADSEAAYDARAVQAALRDSLGITLGVDGIIGPRSREAISRWQESLGTEPTGYLGAGQVRLLLDRGAP